MATPADSVAPTTPTASSPITGVSALWTWLKGIGDWIKALSPSGATKYDTGWVDCTLNTGFTGTAPKIRRIGKLVIFQTFGTLTGTVAASGTTTLVDAIPAEYLPITRAARGESVLSGNSAGAIALAGSGAIVIFNYTSGARTSVTSGTLVWAVD